MSNLSLEEKILYSTVYCAYREHRKTGIACRHPKSFGVCDLDVCPIIQNPYASIVFQRDGIYLMVKRPSNESITGEWEKIKIELDLEKPEETIKFVEEHIEGISPKNREYLLRRLNNIIERYKFLESKGKKVPILEEKPKLIEEAPEEEPLEADLEELSSLERIEEEPKSEETSELDLLDVDELEEEKKD